MFRAASIPGKGNGVVALVDIAKGTRILAEEPLFKMPRHISYHAEQVAMTIAEKLSLLEKNQVQEYLELHNCFEELNPIFGIFKTNAIPASSNGQQGGLFLQASLFNHDCKPKARNRWNEKINMLTIHAVRNIRSGEEITISYTGSVMPFYNRQSKLWDLFRFECTCSLCSLPPALRTHSDNRISNINSKQDFLEDADEPHTPLSTGLRCVRDTLSLMDLEGITEDRAVLMYHYAQRFAYAHRDFPRGWIFLERRRHLSSLEGGEDSPKFQSLSSDMLEYKGVLALIHQPYMPTHFASDMFEAWLWMLDQP